MANPIDQPEVLARFPLADLEIKRFKSYSLESDYTVSTDGWELVVYEEDAKRIAKLRDIELQPVEILIDGAQQLLGRVDVTDIGGDGSAVTLQGRDYIADIVECHVDPALKFKEQMTLGDALKLALSTCGISTIADPDDIAIQNVRSGKKVGGKSGKTFKAIKLEDFKPEPDTGLFDICNRLVARHGATLQPSNKRSTIIVDAPDYKQSPIATLKRTKDQNLSGAVNIISASARRDYSHMPTAALFTSKNGRGGEGGAKLETALDFRKLANAFGGELKAKLPRIAAGTDKAARRKPGSAAGLENGQLYRFLYARDDESRNSDQLLAAAKRSVAQRLKDTLVYRCKLRGHRDEKSGAIWAVNTIVQIDDDICNVHEPLWVHSRRFSNSPSEGATTELICWRPEAFQIGE